jgi:hypothetical protein
MMSLMTEQTFGIATLERLAGRRPTRVSAPKPVVERQSGERDAVLDWLNARTEALRLAGRDVRRLQLRQRRRVWAARIAYHKVTVLE